MNTHVDPDLVSAASGSQPRFAMVTASHGPDFERCRLLCESMDRWVTGARQHYLLVASHDVALFRQLEGPNRLVVDERDILPAWLHAFRDPLSLMRRHIWLSFRTPPLRGWHVQQMRRIAIAEKAEEDVLVFCDSDVFFVRPFDCAGLHGADGLAFYRKNDGIGAGTPATHSQWVANAGLALGLDQHPSHTHDYIATLIAWRRETVLGMCRHIENLHGRHWAAAIAARRHFSECILYGRYVDEVLDAKGHARTEERLCRVLWNGQAPSDEDILEFLAGLKPHQVAVAIQSFLDVEPSRLRRLLLQAGL
ncbi:MAG: DUF6492 family protein [Mesorhizobium sp.]|nr:DUF6492 family protein [Mesorhizobium sp.]